MSTEDTGMVSIVTADNVERVELVRELTAEYARLPHILGRWPDAPREVEALPGDYVAPSGGLLLAMRDGRAIGSVGWIRIDESTAELKRLYVRPDARTSGAGRALVRGVIQAALDAGCATLRLDTIPALTAANALYASMGFEPTDRFSDDLYPDAHCYALDLTLGW